MEAGSGDLDDPARAGFHLRGFHGITPETDSTCFYFWTISSNKNPDRPDMREKIHRDTAFTFDEDRAVIEAQYANMKRFPEATLVGIQVDAPLNKARRIITRLTAAAMVARDR
jgi:vanillate O-demethylase oxygenase-like protein